MKDSEVESRMRSPCITSLSWGRLEVECGHQFHHFKDAKVFPGGCREGDWTETGTRHVPGIQPVDVEELLDHGAGIVILSRGINKRLEVSAETLRMLEGRGVRVQVLQTEEAVRTYNELCESEPVGGLFHSTC